MEEIHHKIPVLNSQFLGSGEDYHVIQIEKDSNAPCQEMAPVILVNSRGAEHNPGIMALNWKVFPLNFKAEKLPVARHNIDMKIYV